MPDIVKIPFTFCRIKRAAELLGISHEDLLSLAVSGKINLCVKLNGFEAVMLASGTPDKLAEWYSSLKNDSSSLALAKSISKYSSFWINSYSPGEEGGEAIFSPYFRYVQLANGESSVDFSTSGHGLAFGLWIPQLTVISSVLDHGKSPFYGSVRLSCADEGSPSILLAPLSLNYSFTSKREGDTEEYEDQFVEVELTADDLWITSEQVRTLLECNGDYGSIQTIDSFGGPTNPDLMPEIKKINHIAEHHAKNRENLYRAAIYILSKYPDECRGEKKEISPEKWRDCIVDHKHEVPPLAINNGDVMLRHLRSAVNGKV